ncbi:universal stress protein [Streptomyces sp. NPDC015661]|uniref:universal stress protein n=1 Tax=Streptomyces sp. NPDC015661 TaxID=3364961 RepID=UPI0037015494
MDGSRTCGEAVAFAVEEASLREARLRAVWVRPRSFRAHGDVEEELAERRRLLSESVAGWAERHPDVRVTAEVLRGHPVEQLGLTSRESLALVVGRRGRLGSTVRGLLHRAQCPLITVPLPLGAPLPERDGAMEERRAGRPPGSTEG